MNECSQVDLELGSGRRACAARLINKIRELPEVRTYKRVPSICRVNQQLRKLDPEAYEPKAVSFGPLHHGKDGLITMEKLKLEVLRQILLQKGENTLDIFLDDVFQCLDEARKEYSEKIELTDDEFAQMLMIDGCFFIVLCCWKIKFDIIDWNTWPVQSRSYYPHALDDLWLLENQIPFSVVNKLFERLCEVFPDLKKDFPSCMNFLLKCMKITLPRDKYPQEKDVRHLFHLICLSNDTSLLPDKPNTRSCWQNIRIPVEKVMEVVSTTFFGLFYLILFRDCSGLFCATRRSPNLEVIRTATELQEMGIMFRAKPWPKKYYTPCDFKISFTDGTLEIPPLTFDGSSCRKIRNLIAFEQSTQYSISSHMTHFFFLLDNLINTQEDVSILRQQGIFENKLGSDIELAELVNSLCKEVYMWRKKDPYSKLREDVHKFCQIPHNRWRASLVHNYFQSPWTIFSVLAATILVVFTVAQTLFTIFPRK